MIAHLRLMFLTLVCLLPTLGLSQNAPPPLAPPAPTDPCATPSLRVSTAINFTTATTAKIIPNVTGKVIYVCSYVLTVASSAATPTSVQFVYGVTAVNPCDTLAVTLTGAMIGSTIAGQTTLLLSSGIGSIFSPSTVSFAACLITTGPTVSVQGHVTYIQQ